MVQSPWPHTETSYAAKFNGVLSLTAAQRAIKHFSLCDTGQDHHSGKPT
jgi:hypothetical protein